MKRYRDIMPYEYRYNTFYHILLKVSGQLKK